MTYSITSWLQRRASGLRPGRMSLLRARRARLRRHQSHASEQLATAHHRAARPTAQ